MTQGAKDISRDPQDQGRLATWDARYIASRSENGPIRWIWGRNYGNERQEIKKGISITTATTATATTKQWF
jgi:hypothetical protein